MKPELLQYIRHLTKQDKKSLTQKTLKTVEEVGELAKVVLPYENAYATTHRFVERERILEEAVDATLCTLSVAYELDFTDEEIEEMMYRKAEKWAGLQAKEEKVTYPLPFEVHITIDLSKSIPNHKVWEGMKKLDAFRDGCSLVNVKPIVLDLQDKAGESVMTDVMTSSKHFGDNRSAYLYAVGVGHELSSYGFEVVRTKIETVPWHPAAPAHPSDTMPLSCYFESHIPVTLHDSHLDHLSSVVQEMEHGVHLSRNVFKRTPDGEAVVMLTHRSYDGWNRAFQHQVDDIVKQLTDRNWNVGKVHVEFAVYDTKVAHDSSWILAQ